MPKTQLPTRLTPKDIAGSFPDHLMPKDMTFMDKVRHASSHLVQDDNMLNMSKTSVATTEDGKAFITLMENKLSKDGHHVKKDGILDKQEIILINKNYF